MTEESGLDMDLSSGIAAFESKQFTTATRLLAPLAEAGDPEAQYRMAIMAQNGLGMVANELLAFKYMRAAAEAGLGLAQHGLGFMYMQGECVERGDYQYLEISVLADPEDPRADDFNGDFQGGIGWGLHLVDVSIAIGNLLDVAESQSEAWLAAQD